MEVERLEERDKAEIGELTCLFEAVPRFLYPEHDGLLSRFTLLAAGGGEKGETRLRGKKD